MHTVIAQALSSVTLGTPVSHENLTMIPLLGPPSVEQEPSYLTLDQALGLGWTEVTEISDQGSVPELRVINKGGTPVFVLDGEELVGAKQNRVVNLSILVPATTALTIPVSCVEAGRWRARSRAFTAAPRTQYARGRAKRMAQVTASLRMSGSRQSDQADVWADIAAKSDRLGTHSPTAAMEEIFVTHAEFTDAAVAALRPVERQAGALFLIDGRVVGFDLFDRAATLRRLLPKLVRSVAIDALESARTPSVGTGSVGTGSVGADFSRPVTARIPESALGLAAHFLAVVCQAKTHEAPAVGLGRDVRLDNAAISGAALLAEEGAIHVSAFSLN